MIIFIKYNIKLIKIDLTKSIYIIIIKKKLLKMTDIKQKNLKKMLKKVQNDPKMQEMINQLQKNLNLDTITSKTQNMTARDRVKDKLKNYRSQRGGKYRQQLIAEKKDEKDQKTKEQQETKSDDPIITKTDVNERLTTALDDIKKQKKLKSDRLKKLQKKYGLITLERYTDALKNLTDSTLKEDQINHERNITDLYIKQNSLPIEQTIDVDESDTDDEIVDIEKIDI